MSDGVMRQILDDEPVMKAWKAYQQTEEYRNTMLWAGQSNKGQIWAAFIEGWRRAGGEIRPQ